MWGEGGQREAWEVGGYDGTFYSNTTRLGSRRRPLWSISARYMTTGYVQHTDSYDNAFYDGGRQLVLIPNDGTGSEANRECEGLNHQVKQDGREEEVAHA